MKKNFLSAVLMVGASTLWTGAALQAQTKAAADIPFAFHIHSSQLPAGKYLLARVSVTAPSMEMRDADTGKSVLFQAGVPEQGKPEHTRLVFNRYGDEYFLSEIWDNDGNGHKLIPNRLEKEVRAAAQSSKPILAQVELGR